MTGFLIFLTVIASLVSAVFGLILTIKAFRTSLMWGLIALFLPLGVWIHAFLNWDECKKPFLGQVGATVATFVFMVMAFASMPSLVQSAEFQAAMDESYPATAPQAVRPRSVPTSTAPSSTVRTPAPSAPSMPSSLLLSGAERRRARKPIGEIQFSAAGRHVGDKVRITDYAGHLVEGNLVSAHANSLVIEKRLSAGVMTVEVPRNEVDALEVIRR